MQKPVFSWDMADKLFPGAKEDFVALSFTLSDWHFDWSHPSYGSVEIDGIFAHIAGDCFAFRYLYFEGKWKRL